MPSGGGIHSIKLLRWTGIAAKGAGVLVIALGIGLFALIRPGLFNALVGLFK